MKIGLEQEFFLTRKGKPVIVPTAYPHDDCGLLLEARGNPDYDQLNAVYSVMADAERIKRNLSTDQDWKDCKVEDRPSFTIPRPLALELARQFTKGLIRYRNLYGHEHHSNNRHEIHAGLHISFTKQVGMDKAGTKREPENRLNVGTFNEAWDFPILFRHLDTCFATTIKQAGRKPGFYEVKHDGRIEYRSLPANVSFGLLMDVLTDKATRTLMR